MKKLKMLLKLNKEKTTGNIWQQLLVIWHSELTLSYLCIIFIYMNYQANLSSMVVGLCLGWTSPVNPKLTQVELNDSPLLLVPSSEELSW